MLFVDELAELIHADPQDLNVPQGLKSFSPNAARAVLERRGFEFPQRNIVFHCLKGGAAKTTLAYNCAFRLFELGAKVLLVDLDKQANATQSLPAPSGPYCFVDVITGRAAIADAVVNVSPGLDLLPSSLENARLEMELMHVRRNPRSFYREVFAPIRQQYDMVLLDLPPDLSQNTFLSTLFADWVVIPVNADAYATAGMRMTLESIEGIREEFGHESLEVLVVWTRFDPREKSSHDYAPSLTQLPAARLLPTVVRTDVTFKHAQAQGKSVFQLRRRSNARQDLDALVRELSGLEDAFGPVGGQA